MKSTVAIIILMLMSFCLTSCEMIVSSHVKSEANKAKEKTTDVILESLKKTCEFYQTSYKKYPEKLDDLIHTPDNRPMLDENAKFEDSWNQPIIYEKTDTQIKLYSIGMDGKKNTEDDIIKTIDLSK